MTTPAHHRQGRATVVTVISVLIICFVVSLWAGAFHRRHGWDELSTVAYLKDLDVSQFEVLGTSYTSDRYSSDQFPDRVNQYQTNLAYIAELEKQLIGINRPLVLKTIFEEVTSGATTDMQRHLALLSFLQRVSVNRSGVKLVYSDGHEVSDPLLLLEANIMKPRQAARLAVDLFLAGGYPARLVNLDSHVAAEVWYEDDWHIFDADLIAGNGLSPIATDSSIPSIVELAEHPEWIDVLPHRFELVDTGLPKINGSQVGSWNYFREVDNAGRSYERKFHYVTPLDPQYGWGKTYKDDADWTPTEQISRFQPGMVRFKKITIEKNGASKIANVTIAWKPAKDNDNDLLGYRVYVATQSRGWYYSSFYGAPKTLKYWSSESGWRPEMYDQQYQLPPHDIEIETTEESHVELALRLGKSYFITVMAFDRYHDEIGRELYLMSNELRIDLDSSN